MREHTEVRSLLTIVRKSHLGSSVPEISGEWLSRFRLSRTPAPFSCASGGCIPQIGIADRLCV